ncbi:harmonin isoform X2 [Agrilus planipennis]|uniref:Harmonin isoform X2 n=1 Tax=Agrilus planipennis TaxID=224129 RepID=A0A1W4WTZ9_AGRPL|nr:harmonin isoform X2 [Agrilus planipennis]
MLTMVDYTSQYASSTISSDTLSGSVTSVQPRIRTVRLVRPNVVNLPPPGLTAKHGPTLGFSIRGGREFGTGFFVSNVELGSEAQRNGLKVGDQILRINGFAVEDAVHKEVLQLISNHTHLTLKVRSVGMIPIKDKSTDPLTWTVISEGSSSTRSSPQLSEKIHDVRISIMVAPRTKLGCGICKGPDWKPGIFVQFTKEGGIAREAGLRPGDQILICNNVDFSDIPFNEAVNLMKSARQLDLVVRKSPPCELFPGESSGYNSSASSVTGDQSPSWSDSKRLSIVKEESTELEDRLCQLKSSKKWKEEVWEEEPKPPYKTTVVSFKDTKTLNDFMDENSTLTRAVSNKIADMRLSSSSSAVNNQETKTVVAEVHKIDNSRKDLENSPPFQKKQVPAENCDSSTLSSALSLEIQRRMQRKCTEMKNKPSIDEELQKKKILKGISTNQQTHHTKLMDEFKLVHKKMFRSSEEVEEVVESATITTVNNIAASPKDRDYSRVSTKSDSYGSSPVSEATERVSSPKQNGTTPSVCPPPPPPPPPFGDVPSKTVPPTTTVSRSPTEKQKPKQPPPVPIKYSTLSTTNRLPQKIGGQPPPSPIPDYDNLNFSSNTLTKTNSPIYAKPITKTSHSEQGSTPVNGSVSKTNGYGTLKSSPANGIVTPKLLLSNGDSLPNSFGSPPQCPPLPGAGGVSPETSTLRKRPVSVVIGEYPSDTLRRQPGKLDFLQNSLDEIDRSSQSSGDSISSQLASELAQTLNRSNLRRKTESVANE